MFLLYDFNVVLFFYICANFLLVAFRAFSFGWTSYFSPNYIMLNFLYCYKTSCVIVCVANNLYGWIELDTCFIFYLLWNVWIVSYKCVVEINVLFKCEVLIILTSYRLISKT